MKNSTEQLYAVVAPGFEQLCAAELQAVTGSETTVTHGGIAFRGKLRELYLANLWLRTASRILVRMDSIKCRDFPTLFQKAARLPWGRFIKAQRQVSIRVTCHSSRLNHSDRVAATIKDALDKALGGNTNLADKNSAPQIIFARLENDVCTLSIDSSGELLHRRGYRQQATAAPMRETLAAGCLLHCGWDGQLPLWDPFCGSGTIPIEGALIAANIPPGIGRNFAFMHWPGFRHGLWDALKNEADRKRREGRVKITGSDTDRQALKAAQHNAMLAGVEQLVTFDHADALQAPAPAQHGLLLCNPPYGERLALQSGPNSLLHKLRARRKHNYPEWRGYALLPYSRDKGGNMFNFSNGGLDVALYPLHEGGKNT